MPTLPLYETPTHPNAWRRVIAPGGYEAWHFDATDTATGVRVTVDFFDGYVFDPAYRRAYERFRQRPTRNTPPAPRDFPCMRIGVLDKDETPLWRRATMFPPGSFTGSVDHPEVSVGETCTMRCDDAGEITLAIRDLPPHETDGSRVTIELTFRPTGPASAKVARVECDDPRVGHFRVVPCKKYDVTGDLTLQFKDGTARTIRIAGRGQHDHLFGTGVIEEATRTVIAKLRLVKDVESP